jgi:ribonuclease P protein component
MFNSGLDIVVIARKGSDACDYAGIESALLHLFKLNGTLVGK